MSIDQIDPSTTRDGELDEAKLEAFAGQVLGDVSTVLAAATTYIGHRAGLYDVLASGEQLTPDELADRAGTHPRYAHEWLGAQAANGYVVHDPTTGTFRLPVEHAVVLTDRSSPAYLGGTSDVMAGLWAAAGAVADDFTTGDGVAWEEHDPRVFSGTEELFRPSYEAFLATEWIPSLDGIAAKLTAGGSIADVGCGHGVSTVVMARAFPASRVHGFDGHAASITTARERAEAAGVADRASFDVALAADLPGGGYDLVCFFDALHDMGDPVAALERARAVLAPGGAVMLIEPLAGDGIEDNLTPVGKLFYAASTLVCTPNGIAQDGGSVLGAQAGEAALREVLARAGFSRVRRAAEAPINLVLEARP